MSFVSPVLSVCLISYNQVEFIRVCLESVISQSVNFDWEIIIADDFSTDGTRDILIEFQNRYPDQIRLKLQPNNCGPARNFRDLMSMPRGEFVAYMECDDYWCSSSKLQRQVDILRSDSSLVGIFHNVDVLVSNEMSKYRYCSSDLPRLITTRTLLDLGNVIPSCSIVFRRESLVIPSWIDLLHMGDWPMYILLSLSGDWFYMPEPLGVYRIHKGGRWSGSSNYVNQLYIIEAYNAFLTHLSIDHELVSLCEFRIRDRQCSIINEFLLKSSRENAIRYFFSVLRKDPWYVFSMRFIKNIRFFLRSYLVG